MGERTPHLDPNVRAALVGLAANHTRGHVVRAVLEGVAFSLRDTFTIFNELGVPVQRMRLGGGGARSPLWRQIQADVYGQPVETVPPRKARHTAPRSSPASAPASGQASTRRAIGWCTSSVAASPNPATVASMNERYDAYRRVYPALRCDEAGRAVCASNTED